MMGNSKGRGDNSSMGYILGAAWGFQTKVHCLAIFRIKSLPRIVVFKLLKIIEAPEELLFMWFITTLYYPY